MKKIFFDIFAIHSSSRHEKRCQISVRLFSLFRGSIYQQWYLFYYISYNMARTSGKRRHQPEMSPFLRSHKGTCNSENSKIYDFFFSHFLLPVTKGKHTSFRQNSMREKCLILQWGQFWVRVLHKHKCIQITARVSLVQNPFSKWWKVMSLILGVKLGWVEICWLASRFKIAPRN